MKELINFLTDWGDISVGVVFVLIPFSAFVALFHHVILGGIYGWDYKPKWLLFVLEPTLVCFLGVIKPGFGLCALVLLFVLTFVLAIVGLIIMPLVRRLRKVKAEYRKTGKKVSVFTAGKVTGTYISGIIGMLVIMFIMEVSLPLIFLVVFIILPLFALKNPGGDRHFMRLQAILPTSPIRSVAMGLAEVEGIVVPGGKLIAPIGDTECIAYEYEIEDLKSATKLFSVLLASKRPLITELADKLRLKYPLLPTISPCPTMRLEAIRSIIPISCRRYPKSV